LFYASLAATTSTPCNPIWSERKSKAFHRKIGVEWPEDSSPEWKSGKLQAAFFCFETTWALLCGVC